MDELAQKPIHKPRDKASLEKGWELKNLLEGINSRLKQSKERISEKDIT